MSSFDFDLKTKVFKKICLPAPTQNNNNNNNNKQKTMEDNQTIIFWGAYLRRNPTQVHDSVQSWNKDKGHNWRNGVVNGY